MKKQLSFYFFLSALIFSGCGEGFRSNFSDSSSDSTPTTTQYLGENTSDVWGNIGEYSTGVTVKDEVLAQEILSLDLTVKALASGNADVSVRMTINCANSLVFEEEVNLQALAQGNAVNFVSQGGYSMLAQCAEATCSQFLVYVKRTTETSSLKRVVIPLTVRGNSDGVSLYTPQVSSLTPNGHIPLDTQGFQERYNCQVADEVEEQPFLIELLTSEDPRETILEEVTENFIDWLGRQL